MINMRYKVSYERLITEEHLLPLRNSPIAVGVAEEKMVPYVFRFTRWFIDT